MGKLRLLNKLTRIAIALGLLAIASVAPAMTVQPLVLDLTTSARGMSRTVTVTNSFAYPLAVELRAEGLTLDAGGVHPTGIETDDLLIFPPQALIQPGQSQVFRVQYVGDPQLAGSKHYYLTVTQLPVQQPHGRTSIKVLYNFQVLVSVSPEGATPALRIDGAQAERSASGRIFPTLSVSNPSPAHGYLANGRLRIIQMDAAGREIFRRELPGPELQQMIGYGLIGSGQTRRVTVPIELPAEGGTVVTQFTPEG